jgi:thiamine biosynthesis lipoprotein
MRHLLLVCPILAALAATTADAADPPKLRQFAFDRGEMAVPMRIILYAQDEVSAAHAAKGAFDRIRQLNSIFSDYDSQSELCRLSATAGSGRAVPVSEDLWRVLSAAQAVSERSDGAFDVTVGPVVRLWRRARRQRQMPSPERLQAARQLVGFRLVTLEPKTHSVRLARAGMQLDLGGIAKGYAMEEALKVLRKHGIRRTLVHAGGDLRLGDPPPDRSGWRVALGPLEVADKPSRYLSLADCAVATSGDAWQFVEIKGRRYSHIVNPQTGLGLTDHSSVTIVAPDGTTADALASAVSVLGPEKGLKLVESTPGVAALIVRAPEGKVETYESKRWKTLAAVKR